MLHKKGSANSHIISLLIMMRWVTR